MGETIFCYMYDWPRTEPQKCALSLILHYISYMGRSLFSMNGLRKQIIIHTSIQNIIQSVHMILTMATVSLKRKDWQA